MSNNAPASTGQPQAAATPSSAQSSDKVATHPAPHRSKTVAGLLALLFGWSGAHRMYMGSRWWWVYPIIAMPAMGLALAAGGEQWFRHPGFFVAAAVALAGMLEAIVTCLTPDEKWDARHNPHSGRVSGSGWAPVLIAAVALMLGAILMVSVLAISLEGYMEATRRRTM